MWPNYPGAKFIGTAFQFRNRTKKEPSCFHVLHRNLNFVTSRCSCAETGEEMFLMYINHVLAFVKLKLLCRDVLVDVGVVVSQGP